MGAEPEIQEALRPLVAAMGLEMWDVERSGASLTVLVDRQGGVDLDSLAVLSRAISDFLDEHDHLVPAGRYELDVSSPGLERRLRSVEHFERCVGQEIAVKTSVAVDGARRFQGRLVSVGDGEVVLSADLPSEELSQIRLPLNVIERAHTVFRWAPPPRPVSPSKGKGRVGASKPRSAANGATAQASKEG